MAFAGKLRGVAHALNAVAANSSAITKRRIHISNSSAIFAGSISGKEGARTRIAIANCLDRREIDLKISDLAGIADQKQTSI